ncbi:hypothetical protein LOZ36_003809 [Ophidiomyces ophidiicola]|nr:hypothetical protein LOZ36_003809 [Ophidiomyces ophidiicola]
MAFLALPLYFFETPTLSEHHMPSLETLHHPSKRKHLEHPSETLDLQPKRQKSCRPQAYWDNLSTVHLTRSAIQELDRRNNSSGLQQPLHRPVTRQLHPDFLRDCSSSHLKAIKRLSRLGGPDLSDLRNSELSAEFDRSRCLPLWLRVSRRFPEEAFDAFALADAHASKEKPVISSVIPIIDGDIGDRKCVGGDYLFGNLAPLTDGTLAPAKPDHFYGARPEQLNRQIRNVLKHHIVPSTQDDLPVAPNFFLEAKGPDGSLAVAMRQACYDGALGARSMQSLQSYPQDMPTYDNNAYTLTSIYHGGTLKLYTTHPGKSNDPDHHSEYFMTQLRSYSLTDTPEAFRQGASAYRNARDWAKEKRDEFIRAANLRLFEACSSASLSQHQLVSDLTPVLDDSDGSTEPGEYQDAQWSFAVPVEGGEEDSGKFRMPRRPRIRASESLVTTGNPASDITSDKALGLQN